MFCASFSSHGQEREPAVVLPNTDVKYFVSEINNVSYKLYISYPLSYRDSVTKKYPVLYLLDADYSFAIAKNISDHLAERNHLQEMIIVGIAYQGPNKYRIHRTRDYTPTNSPENVWFSEIQKKYSGGASKFASVLETELIPLIERGYRTTEVRVLTGHSYGGLFSSWVLLTKPNLFTGYIIVSPSLWYDSHLILRLKEKISEYAGDPIKVFFAVGSREVNENWNMPNDLNEFVNYLEGKRLNNIIIKKDICENETHNSIFPRAFSTGLRFVYDGI